MTKKTQKRQDIVWFRETPFIKEWQDPKSIFQVNGNPMSRAIWNLVVSKRDINMWVNHNMRANRNWKVTDVKKYFGIKGSGQKLLQEFMELYENVMAVKDGKKRGGVMELSTKN